MSIESLSIPVLHLHLLRWRLLMLMLILLLLLRRLRRIRFRMLIMKGRSLLCFTAVWLLSLHLQVRLTMHELLTARMLRPRIHDVIMLLAALSLTTVLRCLLRGLHGDPMILRILGMRHFTCIMLL
jgi:hypothetical protein